MTNQCKDPFRFNQLGSVIESGHQTSSSQTDIKVQIKIHRLKFV